jgi:hypothetical protein
MDDEEGTVHAAGWLQKLVFYEETQKRPKSCMNEEYATTMQQQTLKCDGSGGKRNFSIRAIKGAS